MSDFQDLITDDLSVFYNTDEFGTSAEYTPSGGAAVTIVVDIEQVDPDFMSDAGPANEMEIWAKTADVPSPDYGDQFVIDGQTWYLLENLPSYSDGETKLRLTRSDHRRV